MKRVLVIENNENNMKLITFIPGAGCEGYIEKPVDPILGMKQIEKVIGAS